MPQYYFCSILNISFCLFFILFLKHKILTQPHTCYHIICTREYQPARYSHYPRKLKTENIHIQNTLNKYPLKGFKHHIWLMRSGNLANNNLSKVGSIHCTDGNATNIKADLYNSYWTIKISKLFLNIIWLNGRTIIYLCA